MLSNVRQVNRARPSPPQAAGSWLKEAQYSTQCKQGAERPDERKSAIQIAEIFDDRFFKERFLYDLKVFQGV